MPSAEDFKLRLHLIFLEAQRKGLSEIEVSSDELHRRVGGYPGQDHRMPLCCQVMQQYLAQDAGDQVVEAPAGDQDSTLTIRYLLPRPAIATR